MSEETNRSVESDRSDLFDYGDSTSSVEDILAFAHALDETYGGKKKSPLDDFNSKGSEGQILHDRELYIHVYTNGKRYRYCRMLEEGSFRGRTADFVFMFLFGGAIMTIVALFVSLVFLGQAFTIMLVYIWSRRNPYVRMNFFGLLTFKAPFLPWVLFGFSLLLGNSVTVDVIGIAVGHVYYFLEDVFPEQPGGFRILKTPGILKAIFDAPPEDPNYEPLPEEDRPGGFNWGEGQRVGAEQDHED